MQKNRCAGQDAEARLDGCVAGGAVAAGDDDFIASGSPRNLLSEEVGAVRASRPGWRIQMPATRACPYKRLSAKWPMGVLPSTSARARSPMPLVVGLYVGLKLADLTFNDIRGPQAP